MKCLSDCALWTGAKDSDGYGHRWIAGKVVKAHRVAWAEKNGPIPTGMFVLHRCDVRACVNPDHLFLGTHRDNMADKKAKGRAHSQSGETNGQSKLTAVQVRAIRAAAGPLTEVARLHGVSRSTIANIRSRKTWVHL